MTALMSPVRPQSEADLQACVLDLAKVLGWRCVHFRPAMTTKGYRTAVQGDGKGWPDIFAVKGARLLAVELKRNVDAKLRPEQETWLALLKSAGVETHVWYPNHWPEAIVEVLSARGGKPETQ